MKTKEVAELYEVLSSVKLTGMTTSAKMTILENIRTLKPATQAYKSDCDDAIRMLRPEGFDAIEEKANRHNEAIRAKNDKDQLSPEELQKVNETYAAYIKEVEVRAKELGEVEHDISLKSIDQSEFEKLCEANDLPAGSLFVMCENLIKA